MLIMMKQNNCLKPVYESDFDAFQKIKDGQVKVTITRPRNLKHHRKFFAVLKMVCDNSERFNSPEDLLIALKFSLNYIESVNDLRDENKKYMIPKSINFESMNQTAFEEFYNRALPLLANEIGVTITDFEENYVNYM